MSEMAYPGFRRIHFVGIGGVGMCGIAEVLVNLGYCVSGSDLTESPTTRRLSKLGASVQVGHSAEGIADVDVVVTSSAVRADNVEVQRAVELSIPVIPRVEMLAELMRLKYGIAVAGSHGKTTTTSLTAQVVAEGGLDPTIVVGGRLGSLGANARLGQGEFLVCEADESDGSFLRLSPTIAVVTNIDEEHLDAYSGSVDVLTDAFVEFCNAIPFYGAAIVCVDDHRIQGILPRVSRRVVTYGASVQADLAMRDVVHGDGTTSYTAVLRGEELGRVTLNQPGHHVALDSLAAIAVALELSIPFEVAATALGAFEGVDRRMSLRGEVAGVRVVDDYAHHPTELAATLLALREGHGAKHLIALFQPHRFTRVESLHEGFCQSFHEADTVLVCPIYAAGESPIEGVDSASLVEGLRARGHKGVLEVAGLDEAVAKAADIATEGDVVVTLGAGDITKAAPRLLALLGERAKGGQSS